MSFSQMSLTGGVMVIVITVLRALLLNRLPKRTFIILWETAMLRLVLPFSFASVTSIYALFARTEARAEAINVPNIEALAGNNSGLSVSAAQVSAGIYIPVWTVVRLAGTAVMLIFFALGYVSVYRRYRFSTLVKSGYAVDWLSERKIKRRVRICLSEQTNTPLTYGIFRPTILLPANTDMGESERLRYVLAHEMTHIRRFDILRKAAAVAVLCLHWFNPAVWVLFVLYNRDIELACDEAVVKKSGGDCRSAYAMTLISMGEQKLGRSSLFSHFSRNAVEERIVAIMKTRRTTFSVIPVSFLLIAGITCAFATSPIKSGVRPLAVTELSSSPSIMENRSGSASEVCRLNGWTDTAEDELMAKYGRYGLSFKDGKPVFKGKWVRYFCDCIDSSLVYTSEEKFDAMYHVIYACYNKDGVTDVYTCYNENGVLISLREAGKDEFDIITDFTENYTEILPQYS